MPLVSVIIPLFNKAKWIERCVRSALQQAGVDFEILVIDDGSTDESGAIVSSIKDARIKMFSQPNKGPSAARNVGIEISQGEYLAFLDADDEWRPYHLYHLLRGFKHFPEAVLVCDEITEVHTLSQPGIKFASLDEPTAGEKNEDVQFSRLDNYLRTLSEGHFVLSGSSVLIRSKTVLKNQLFFIQDSEPAEDVNYWIRLAELGDFVFCRYPGALYHRVDPLSLMNKKATQPAVVPPYFFGVDLNTYDHGDRRFVRKFLRAEYLKKGFQNRGRPLSKSEFRTKVGCGIQIGWWSRWLYLLVRLTPGFIFRPIAKSLRNRRYRKS